MHRLVDNLLHDGHVRVIAVVGHWDHGCRWEAPTEAPRAHLRVKLVEELRVEGRVWEDSRVLSQASSEVSPLLVQLLLILCRVLHEVHILSGDDHVLRPVAEEFDVRH